MKRAFFVLLSVMVPVMVNAQLLPISYDRAVTLPATSDIWDVMPLPTGGYVWVVASEVDSEQTRIDWGRTDNSDGGTLTLAVGAPLQMTGFFRDNYDPCVVLASRYMRNDLDSTLFRIYKLADGQPDSMQWFWWSFLPQGGAFAIGWSFFDLKIAAPIPPPPQASDRLVGVVTCQWVQDLTAPFMQSYTTDDIGILLRDMLHPDNLWRHSPPDEIENVTLRECAELSTALDGDSLFISFEGRYTSEGQNNQGYSWHDVQTTLRGSVVHDTLVPLASVSRSTGCSDYLICSTFDSATNTLMTLANVCGQSGALNSHASGAFSWLLIHNYSAFFAADVVPGNDREEFLCYDPARGVFDVLDALDGHSYGVSTEMQIMTAGAKIVGRYDAPSRRLVMRNDNLLQFYRFEEYLGTEASPNSLPKHFALSQNHPNPFNPSTEISYELSSTERVTLQVFDLLGRNVGTLINELQTSGQHKITFDGSRLPSGMYFYQLAAGRFSETKKMLLLK